jgi:hypothetical protein
MIEEAKTGGRQALYRYGAGCLSVLVCEMTIVLQDRLKLMTSTRNRREERR